MTTQIFSLPESDLRRAATESKRVRDHNEKWALGSRDPNFTPLGQKIENPAYTRIRPMLSQGSRVCKSRRHLNQSDINKSFAAQRAHFSYIVDQVLYDDHNISDSSTDSDHAPDHSEAVNDPNIFYSFDAPTGPSQGTDILSAALANAVKKFEKKETENLAREYEFVAIEETSNSHGDGYLADDDFEFISRADL
ncbi:hypothetical protein RJZ56_003599 [Blastomyces dermatitidis]|uniref:Uncharacterized protein n=2 Tax=Blastomyces TaxID=229219 RepID=A0A179V0G8_BLAGS|nr:uncharacterized protein BDBG_08734 [Blastomyces gilchristii SLH14081]EGE86800.1 hypothetical protein BDDG_09750 [Blastomyces dermatitidis ATCC 18188]OAT13553.1 hypothetical protein BDBG_08734 [Blastomyces gilchristii SLH14081]